MALFKRRGERAPGWSPFGDDEEWRAFADLVRADAARRGWTAVPEEAVVVAGETRYGLNNLAQLCREEEQADWQAVVREHFDRMVALPTDTRFGSAEQARAVLKARLVDDGFLSKVPWETATRRVAEDLLLVLAYDLPETVLIPAREEALEWGAEDELFGVALAQTRAEPGIELKRLDLDGAPVSLLSGESFFAATDDRPAAAVRGALPRRRAGLTE